METSNYKNIQYDTYKNTKDVLTTIRKKHEDKFKHHLISQGSFFSDALNILQSHSTQYGLQCKANVQKTYLTSPYGM